MSPQLTIDKGSLGMDSISDPPPPPYLLWSVYHGRIGEAVFCREYFCSLTDDEGPGYRGSLTIVFDRDIGVGMGVIGTVTSQRCHNNSM